MPRRRLFRLHSVPTMTKSLLSALAVAALVSCGGGEPPDDLHPRVIQSRGKFVREVFLIKEIPNLITDLRICNGKIIATGGTASCDVSAPSEVQCIHYRPELRDPFAVISPSRCERIIVGHEWNGGPVVAVAQTGAVLWTRKFDVAPGPLALVHAADGLRVAVILGRSKLALLDLQSSASIREIAGEFSGFIGSGNLAGDDNDEIVTESRAGIDIRRSDGAFLSHRSVEGSVAVTRSGSGKAHIVALFERSLLLLSAENEVTTRLDLPDLPTLSVMYVAAAAE